VANTRVLINCAQAAGVQRLVHVSISNPSIDSRLPYFRGKALLEEAIQQSGLSYAILRPTVIFGREDVLINNIAYLLRRFPVFAVPGSGDYRLQPVFVEDMAELAIQAGHEDKNLTLDVVGPEIFTFDELVSLIAQVLGSRARLIHLPPGLALALSRLVGLAVGDVVLTRDELAGLSAGLLVSSLPPSGQTKFSEWVRENVQNLGREYASEIGRHYQ
jgi:NADH dehydrogenase